MSRVRRFLACFGNGRHGRLGLGFPINNQTLPRIVAGLAGYRVKQVSCGAAHTAVVTDDGSLLTFGLNERGQLGHNGDDEFIAVPLEVGLPESVEAVAAGHKHTLVLTKSGDVWAFGANDYGQLGCGQLDPNPSAPSSAPAGLFNWLPKLPSMPEPRLVKALSGKGVVSIAAAAEHSLALTSSGEVYSWGHASHGALGLGRARHGHREFTPRMVSALHGVKVASISAGYYGSAAIDTGGRAFVWGAGTFGQLGLGGMEHVHVPKALPLPGGGEVRQVVQGFQHGLALTRGGQVFVWGNDTNGCLGQGDGVWVRAPILTPKHLPLGREARFVACGYNHSMAVAEDGSAWAWGNSGAASAGIWDLNADYGGGQLGLGDDTHRGSPHRIVRVMPNRYKHIDVRAADRSQHWKALGVSAGHNHSAMIAEADVSTADLAPPPGAAAAAGTAAARSTS